MSRENSIPNQKTETVSTDTSSTVVLDWENTTTTVIPAVYPDSTGLNGEIKVEEGRDSKS